MSFPNNRLLPSGSKLLVLRELERRSISDKLLEPIPVGSVVTVARDFGAGRLNIWSELGSDILYLFDGDVSPIVP